MVRQHVGIDGCGSTAGTDDSGDNVVSATSFYLLSRHHCMFPCVLVV
jgi:hypothetical protein